MLRFLDRNHAPAIPKSYPFPNGKRVPWESTKRTFGEFANAVMSFAQANGLAVPTLEEIEDSICHQLPRGWCTNQSRFDRPATLLRADRPARKPCRTCGKRR
jgi:hypothetical protein